MEKLGVTSQPPCYSLCGPIFSIETAYQSYMELEESNYDFDKSDTLKALSRISQNNLLSNAPPHILESIKTLFTENSHYNMTDTSIICYLDSRVYDSVHREGMDFSDMSHDILQQDFLSKLLKEGSEPYEFDRVLSMLEDIVEYRYNNGYIGNKVIAEMPDYIATELSESEYGSYPTEFVIENMNGDEWQPSLVVTDNLETRSAIESGESQDLLNAQNLFVNTNTIEVLLYALQEGDETEGEFYLIKPEFMRKEVEIDGEPCDLDNFQWGLDDAYMDTKASDLEGYYEKVSFEFMAVPESKGMPYNNLEREVAEIYFENEVEMER